MPANTPMNTHLTLNRRSFLKTLGTATLTVPFFTRNLFSAPPSRVLRHVSFGAGGMARADLTAILSNEFVKLAAVADVDLTRATWLKEKYPDLKVYQNWRELLDKEQKNFDSCNVSTPDHMHAPIAMSAMQLGKHVYCQKPLCHDIYEVRQLTLMARKKRVMTQMGIQIHSQKVYRLAVALVQSGAIGKVKEIHTWSDRKWGDTGAPVEKNDPVPADFDWNQWVGVCGERPFIGGGYYHPGNWRKRLDFGTGSFGDMGCHIYDPVFEAAALTAPISVRSEGPAPDKWNWSINAVMRYVFPGTRFTEGKTLNITWYDGDERPPKDIQALVAEPAKPDDAKSDGKKKKKNSGGIPSNGSIVIGTKGVLLIPHVGMPKLFPADQFKDYTMPQAENVHHWTEWAEACTGKGKPSANFDYAGPLTEAVLLGSVAVRFPQTTLEWNAAKLKFTNVPEANQFIRRQYRKGWEVKGL